MRPTYVTQPRAPVTFSVSPPPRVTRHESSCPRVAAETGVPPIASRVRVGANASSARSVVPRATLATFVDAEIGAPQRDPQHHEEMASGTRPELVARYAAGGRETPSSKATRATTGTNVDDRSGHVNGSEIFRATSGNVM